MADTPKKETITPIRSALASPKPGEGGPIPPVSPTAPTPQQGPKPLDIKPPAPVPPVPPLPPPFLPLKKGEEKGGGSAPLAPFTKGLQPQKGGMDQIKPQPPSLPTEQTPKTLTPKIALPKGTKLKKLDIKKIIIIGIPTLIGLILLLLVADYTIIPGTLIAKGLSKDATTTINKIEFNNLEEFTTKLKPGNYAITVKQQDFVDFSQQIKIKAGHSTVTLSITLTPVPKLEILAEKVQFANASEKLIRYYSQNTFWLYDIAQNKKENISNPVKGISRVVWSPQKNLAFVTQFNKNYIFDFSRSGFTGIDSIRLPRGIDSLTWSPDGKKIAYTYSPNNKEYSLIVSGADGSGFERIADLRTLPRPINVLWSPNDKTIMLVPQGKEFAKNILYSFDIFSKSVKQLDETGDVKDALFSPNGENIIFSVFKAVNKTKSALYYKAGLKEAKDLNLDASIETTAWPSNSEIISFLPSIVPPTILSLDIPTNKNKDVAIKDTLVSIDSLFMAQNKLFLLIGNTLYQAPIVLR